MNSWHSYRLLLLFACLVGTVRACLADDLPDDATLIAAGARIGTIVIHSRQIFDLDDPRENRALFRAADRLHARTKESVIRAQLLIRSGDPYSARILQETERRLRALQFLREPKVRATRYHDGLVDIEVETHDVWTLQLGPSFGRSGGSNNSSFSFEDQNLFGYGKTLILGVESNVDRNATTVEWRDPAIHGTRWLDDLFWSNTSDGRVRRISVWQPFFSLSAHHAYGVTLGDSELDQTRYALGESFDTYHVVNHSVDVYTGWSSGLHDGRTQRLTAGWHVQRDEFAATAASQAPIPADRRFNYPYLRFDLIRDAFRTERDLELIDRTEDLQFGLSGTAIVGAVTRALGSDRNATLLTLAGNYGSQLTDRQQLFLTAAFSNRFEAGESRDQRYSVTSAWYWRHAPRLLAHIKLSLARGSALDLDHYYSLGGDNGLRGYPLRYQLGSGITQLKMEERFFTGYSLWRLFDVGAAAFFDAGRVHGGNPLGAPDYGWLKDVGVGLRLGNSRSSLGNVIHIDLATPLERRGNMRSLQWLVSTEVSF